MRLNFVIGAAGTAKEWQSAGLVNAFALLTPSFTCTEAKSLYEVGKFIISAWFPRGQSTANKLEISFHCTSIEQNARRITIKLNRSEREWLDKMERKKWQRSSNSVCWLECERISRNRSIKFSTYVGVWFSAVFLTSQIWGACHNGEMWERQIFFQELPAN